MFRVLIGGRNFKCASKISTLLVFRPPVLLSLVRPLCTPTTTLNQTKKITNTANVIAAFSSTRESFKSKSTLQLLRAYVVFALCKWNWLVRNSEHLLKIMTKVFGVWIVNAMLKATFFGHFCAGVNETSIRPTVIHLHHNGIGSILDYAAEADIVKYPNNVTKSNIAKNPNIPNNTTNSDIAKNPNIPDNTTKSDIAKNPNIPDNTTKSDIAKKQKIQIPSKTGVQCRIYDYEDELQCDKNVEVFLTCIRAVHNTMPEGFAAIKVTALCQPYILERISMAIIETRKLFSRFDKDGNGKITSDEFRLTFHEFFRNASEEEVDGIFRRFSQPDSGYIDYVEWTSTIRLEEIWSLVNRSCHQSLASVVLDEEETKLMHNMFSRVKRIAQYAAELEVRLMVDAEQTYFQPAIDHLVLDLQRKFNRKFPTIFNTYQCYLKDCFGRVENDLVRARREGYFFAAKIVRGAYMVLERKRAAEMGYEDPIYPTLEETHANYHNTLNLVLHNIKISNILVATHNQASIEYTLKKMEELQICPQNGGVYFGQLLGMSDHLTFNLGQNGYKAYKYVPYGSVQEVVPYLIRRAQENSNVLTGKVDLQMIGLEITRRLTPPLFHR